MIRSRRVLPLPCPAYSSSSRSPLLSFDSLCYSRLTTASPSSTTLHLPYNKAQPACVCPSRWQSSPASRPATTLHLSLNKAQPAYACPSRGPPSQARRQACPSPRPHRRSSRSPKRASPCAVQATSIRVDASTAAREAQARAN